MNLAVKPAFGFGAEFAEENQFKVGIFVQVKNQEELKAELVLMKLLNVNQLILLEKIGCFWSVTVGLTIWCRPRICYLPVDR